MLMHLHEHARALYMHPHQSWHVFQNLDMHLLHEIHNNGLAAAFGGGQPVVVDFMKKMHVDILEDVSRLVGMHVHCTGMFMQMHDHGMSRTEKAATHSNLPRLIN